MNDLYTEEHFQSYYNKKYLYTLYILFYHFLKAHNGAGYKLQGGYLDSPLGSIVHNNKCNYNFCNNLKIDLYSMTYDNYRKL